MEKLEGFKFFFPPNTILHGIPIAKRQKIAKRPMCTDLFVMRRLDAGIQRGVDHSLYYHSSGDTVT